MEEDQWFCEDCQEVHYTGQTCAAEGEPKTYEDGKQEQYESMSKKCEPGYWLEDKRKCKLNHEDCKSEREDCPLEDK